MALDPVCEKPVNPHNAYWMIWYKGTPYYVDSEVCQLKFDHKPEHYRQLALDRRQNEAVYRLVRRAATLEASQGLGRRTAGCPDVRARGREDRSEECDAA